jgi:hypothetical protein
MRLRPAFLVALALTLALPARAATPRPATPADTSAAPLIARIIEAFGGRAAIERVHAYRMHGTVTAAGHASRTGPTVRLFQRPDRLKVVIDYPDGRETRIVKGRDGWRSNGGPVEEAHGPMLDAMALQACRAGLPWVLIEQGSRARRSASRDLDGRTLEGFELPVRDGLVFRAWVDSTAHVRISQGELAYGAVRTQFETIYDDWRQVGGLWFAHHEENFASGTHTGTIVLDSIQVDPPVRPDEFAPPVSGNTAHPDSS